MISKILSLLAALGLVASVPAKVNPTPKTKALHTSALDVAQSFDGVLSDGQPVPPGPPL